MHIGGSEGGSSKWSWAGRLKLARDYVGVVVDKQITSGLVVAERESRRDECERILAAKREAKNAARTLLKTASLFFSYFREHNPSSGKSPGHARRKLGDDWRWQRGGCSRRDSPAHAVDHQRAV